MILLNFRGGGATCKTAPDCDLALCHNLKKTGLEASDEKFLRHSELDSESIIADKSRLRLGGRSDNSSRMPYSQSRHSDGSQSLSMPINLIFHFCWQKRKKAAFMLAEVLITLGIIGIIAAMTLPSLINNYKSKELETGFKKNYSAINQAINMYTADTGEILHADELGTVELKKILLKYMDVLHECGAAWGSKDCIYNASNQEERSKIYKTYNGKKYIGNLNLFDDGQLVLKDGTLILIENQGITDKEVYISFDVNGYRKSPNKYGHDLFTFQLMNDGRLLPMGAEGTDFTNDVTYCSYSSGHDFNGISCAVKAIYDINYFKNLPR